MAKARINTNKGQRDVTPNPLLLRCLSNSEISTTEDSNE